MPRLFACVAIVAATVVVGTASTAVAAPPEVGVATTVIGSDQAFTAAEILTIGEVVTYQTVLTIPEGTTDALNIVDVLDAGQAVVAIDSATATPSLSSSTGFANALTAGRAALVAPAQTFTLDFGSVANSDSDNATDETITVVYRAIVLNVATNTIDTGKTNTVTVNYTANATGGTESIAVTIISEPMLDTIKTASPAIADANDTITFTVDVVHTRQQGDTDAFNVTTVDDIPAGLTYVVGSLQTANLPAVAPFTIDIVGSHISVVWTSLTRSPLQAGRFTYQAKIDADTVAPRTITNTATTTWTSLAGAPLTTTTLNDDDTQRTGTGGGVNDYVDAGSATVSVANARIVTSLFSSDDTTTAGNNLTIGESGTYQLLVTLPESHISTFQVKDVLPSGLRYVAGSASIITDSSLSDGQLAATFGGSLGTSTFTPTVGPPDTLTFDVSTTTIVTADDNANNNSILIRFDAIVGNVGSNVGFGSGNVVLSNSATVKLAGGTVVTSNVVASNVVEPHLSVVKTFSPGDAAPGGSVSVTITVQNTGLSNGYESELTDTLDGRFDADSVVFTAVQPGWTSAQDDADLSWSAGPVIAPGETVSFVFTVDLLASSPIGPVPNTASATTTSRVGTTFTGERAEPAQTGLAILNVLTQDLNVAESDGVVTAAPGATLDYVVVIGNTGGAPATNVILTDTLPVGTTYVSVTPPCVLSGSTPTAKIFAVGTINSASSASCTIRLNVDNPAPAGTSGYDNTVAVADDGAHGVDPTPLNNTHLDHDEITAAHPDILVDKDDGVTSVSPGDDLTYTITVSNTGNIGASNVQITDAIPDELTGVSCTNLSGMFVTPCAISGGVVSTIITTVAGGGASATIEVVAVVAAVPVPAGPHQIFNTASAIDDGQNGVDPTTGNNSSTDVDVVVLVVPPNLPIVDSTMDLAITNSNGTDISTAGTSTTWHVTITNHGPLPVGRFSVIDLLPAQVSDVSYHTSAGVYDPATQIWNGPAVPVGATITVAVTGLIVADATGAMTNEVTVAPLLGLVDPTPGDNSAIDVDTLVAAPAIAGDREVVPGEDIPLPATGYEVLRTVLPATALVAGGVFLLVFGGRSTSNRSRVPRRRSVT